MSRAANLQPAAGGENPDRTLDEVHRSEELNARSFTELP